MYSQVVDAVNLGILIMDTRFRIQSWNRWMEIHSDKKREDVIGSNLFDLFPHLNTPNFNRSCKSVVSFGNYVYFSQKLHNYLFPFKPTGFNAASFEFMQQSCSMAPIKDKDGRVTHIAITVHDMTDQVYLERSLKLMSQLDGLTEVNNRRFLDTRLEEEFNRFKRTGRKFALAMVDIDNFKYVNDTFGHHFGDLVLKRMSQTCSSNLRTSDILARFGGEEFCIVLPDTDQEGAMVICERIRLAVESMRVACNNDAEVPITVSIGVAVTDSSLESYERLLKNSDAALYASKANGKNRVTAFSGY